MYGSITNTGTGTLESPSVNQKVIFQEFITVQWISERTKPARKSYTGSVLSCKFFYPAHNVMI